jgi:hypothetical protein
VVTVFSSLAPKSVATVSPSLASKLVARVSRFGPQNSQQRFGDLGLKITATVSWFEPQNQVGDSLSVAPQNQRVNEMAQGHTLRSSDLFHMEASRARVFQYGLKTGGGTTAGGARGTIAEVMSRTS